MADEPTNAVAAATVTTSTPSATTTISLAALDALVALAKKEGPKLAPQLVASSDVKPGLKTSEFWICVAVTIAGVAIQFIPQTSPWSHAIGGIMSIAASFGYTASRVAVKNS